MLVMMGAQTGATIANQTVNATFNNMATALNESNTQITSAINQFTNQIETANTKELKYSFYLFSKAQTHVQNLLAQQQTELQKIDRYIQETLSLEQPQINFLTTPTSYDQFFTLATMYTPKGPLWKNPFPVGNWEYDQDHDSFWQMTYAPFLITDADGKTSPDKAANNSIFTEWFSRTSSYEIECEITLYKIQYPFFVGLIFNKTRWISGNTQHLQKYRLFGLYGNQNNTAQICFSEPNRKSNAGKKTIIYPLENIIQGNGIQNITFNSSDLNNISLTPLTFRLKIITSPNQIKCKFWQITSPEPTTFITIKSNDPDLFLYHGIGFISPGAIAQFKLIQPTSLLFSLDAQKTFKAEVESLIQQQLIKINDHQMINTTGVS